MALLLMPPCRLVSHQEPASLQGRMPTRKHWERGVQHGIPN
jgi:hypothetical protein